MAASKPSIRSAPAGLGLAGLAGLSKKLEELAEQGSKTRLLFLELYSLFKISTTLSDKMDIGETLKALKKIVREVFPCEQYSVLLLEDGSATLTFRSHFGFPKRQAEVAQFGPGTDIFGTALKRRRPVYVKNVAKTRNRFQYHPGRQVTSGAFVAIPLLADGVKAVGVMSLFRQSPRSFSREEIELLRKIAGQAAMVIDRITQYQHHRELSMTDELTGIFNRRYFNQRFDREMQRAERYKRPLTVVMIDIDHFKRFNDQHGHLMGDQVLQSVAALLEASVRKSDILARFGGEEFVILLPEIDKEHGRKVAEKLRRVIERADFPREETQPLGRLTISLGVAAFPEDAVRADELLERADRALYTAKTLGRNQVVQVPTSNGEPPKARRPASAVAVPKG